MTTFRDLLAWQKAMDLVDCIYQEVRSFPKSETFGLSFQLRKSASSIPSNIAEGRGRHSTPDYRHFLRQARGSAQELDTQIEIAMRQGFIAETRARELMKLANRVGQLINGLLRSLPER
jgi:four helix bundle protein